MSDGSNLFSDYVPTKLRIEYTSFAHSASLNDNHFNIAIEIPEGKAKGLTKVIFDYLKQEDENEEV